MGVKTNSEKICLNMIVKNEADIIERALSSALEFIDFCVICDTGSDDETITIIMDFCNKNKIPIELHQIDFIDFSQARNLALIYARESSFDFGYILLFDADMELVVGDRESFINIKSDANTVRQYSGSIFYDNVRIIRRNIGAFYAGATHEVLKLDACAVRLDGVHFIDHADGRNRSDKLNRDERLLRESIYNDNSDARSMYYLAQTLRDSGRWLEAAVWYSRRVECGGWEEERWHARYQQSYCELKSGNSSAFIEGCLLAYSWRPSRAEPIVSLAYYFVSLKQYDAALLLAEQAKEIPLPLMDSLFIESHVYDNSPREIISICGYYSALEGRRNNGRLMCESLAIDSLLNNNQRIQARANLIYYSKSLLDLFYGSHLRRINASFPDGFQPTNPSFIRRGDGFIGVIRAVNYKIDCGRYIIQDGGNTIRTENYIAILDYNLSVISLKKVNDNSLIDRDEDSSIRGFEDCRLFTWNNKLWCTATARDLNSKARATMVLLEIDEQFDIKNAYPLLGFADDQHQKNWMPHAGTALKLVYSCGPTIILDASSGDGRFLVESITNPGVSIEHWRGGGQIISWGDGFLAITHEAVDIGYERKYIHRFVELNSSYIPVSYTPSFYFISLSIEFAAGLTTALDGDVLVSFGVMDCEAWLAKVPRARILGLLAPIL